MKIHPQYRKIIIWLSIFSLWSISATKPAPIQAIPTFQSEKITFAVIGDYGQASQTEADVANLVKSWGPDFIVTVGDNNYPNGAASTIDENIGQYYHDYIFPYRGKFGAGAAYKRFFPALGNHDWGTNSANQYFNYFSFYNEIGYYDFTKGSVHFFVLDSDQHEPDGTSSTSEQAKWLRKGLAASTSEFNIVVFHHAPYSSGKHGSTTYMQWPFKTWGADAVLSGHDHIYERILVDGLPYFVNGVGGAELYPYGTVVSGSQIRFNQDYGAMRVEASKSSIKFQFFTRTGLLIDEYTISNSIPTVTSITRSSPNPANTANIDFLVKFSEAVSGVDASDFNLTTTNIVGAAISTINGTGDSYVVSVNSGSGNGTIRLDLTDNDSIINSYGNKLGNAGIGNGNFINGETYSIDRTTPIATSIIRSSPNPSNAASIDYQVNFSEAVVGLDITDFSITSSSGAALSAVNGTGNVYTVSINTGTGTDQVRMELLDNDSITDLAGNQLGGAGAGNGNYTNVEAYSIDKASPFAGSIIRAGNNPSNATSIDFIITFSEAVSGVDAADFTLSTSNIVNAFVSNINNSGPFYVVTVNTGAGTGTIRLDLADNDSIVDAVGNPLGGFETGNGAFVSGETYNVEKSAPYVTSITRTGTSPSNLSLVDWIVTFSESVSGVDPADFSLAMTNVNGAGINSLNGSGNAYTVTANTGVGDGTLRLDLIDNDSIINQGNMPLGSIGQNNGSFINSETYAVDKSVPTVTSIIRAGTNPSSAASIDFIVTFSESITGLDVSDFNLSTNNISGALISSINNANPFYVVTVNTGIGTGSIRLDLSDDDSVSDMAGNRPGGPGIGNGNFVSGEMYNIEKSFPRVTSITRASPNPANSASVDYIVTFSESVSGVDVSDFKVNTSSLINTSILNVTNVDPFYIVTVSTGVGTGTIRLDLIDNDSISNLAGSKLGGPNAENGNFVNGETFSISKAPANFPAPSLREPRQNYLTNNSRLSFSWDKVRDASAYEITIALDSNFTQVITTQVVNQLSYTNNVALSDGTYYWRVRAYNSSYQPGKFSVTSIFIVDTTPPPTPNLLSPANNTSTTKTKFVWDKISSATKYQIEIDNRSDFSSPEWSSLRNQPNYQTSNMRRGTYYWRVRAKDMAGNWSEWSVPFSIKVP